MGADYVNRIAPIFFAEYIQLDVVILNRQQYSRVSRFGFQSFSLNVSIAFLCCDLLEVMFDSRNILCLLPLHGGGNRL